MSNVTIVLVLYTHFRQVFSDHHQVSIVWADMGYLLIWNPIKGTLYVMFRVFSTIIFFPMKIDSKSANSQVSICFVNCSIFVINASSCALTEIDFYHMLPKMTLQFKGILIHDLLD